MDNQFKVGETYPFSLQFTLKVPKCFAIQNGEFVVYRNETDDEYTARMALENSSTYSQLKSKYEKPV